MSKYFEEDEPEPEESSHDHIVTFGGGAAVGIVICVILICGMCFGIGYSLGKRNAGPASASATTPAAQTPAPDQEPLEGGGGVPKPSAGDDEPMEPAPTVSQGVTPPAASDGANPPAAQPSPAQPAPQASAPAPTAPAPVRPAAPTPVRSAMPAPERTPPAEPAPAVRAAMPMQTSFMVQIAAVANPEDAGVLVNALRKRNYAVAARRDPADGLIHVRLGPFTSHDEASRWRDKLLSDGYNAVIQP